MSPETSALVAAAVLMSVAHGLLPNHWLPFVLVARAQRWTARTMMTVLVAAAAAHTAVAGAVALLALVIGQSVRHILHPVAHILPGIIMVAAGLSFIGLDLASKHHHSALHDAHARGMSDSAAATTLILSLALSPCEAMVPIFVAAAPRGDPLLLSIMVVTSGLASMAVMALLAYGAWQGAVRLEFGRYAHKERTIVGSLLLLMGLALGVLGLFEA